MNEKTTLTVSKTSLYHLQPSDWTEFDSEWSDRVKSLEEGLRLRDESNGSLSLWELPWHSCEPVRL
jgi:hypothetical protein